MKFPPTTFKFALSSYFVSSGAAFFHQRAESINPPLELEAMENQTVVYIVDDDASVLRSLKRLLRSAGFAVEAFTSAESFLLTGYPLRKGCLILDIHLPGIDGLELQEKLVASHCKIPLIFITAQADAAKQAQAMAAGAAAFLLKPVDDQVLLDAITAALKACNPGVF